jgi:hypothetical protein
MRLSLSTAVAILLGLAPLSAAAQETYESASLDPNGRLHIVTTNHRDVLVPLSGLPIFQWHFADSGTQVAFGQEPVHFACSIHYELRDVRSERLLDSADVPQPCGQDPDPKPVAVPKWVTELEADHK